VQKKNKLPAKIILIFVVALSANLFFKSAPTKTAEIGCCHITQPGAGDTTYQCWNTRPENCSPETGVTGVFEYIPKTQTCNLINECAGAIQPPAEAICDSTGCRDQSGGTPVNIYGSPIIEASQPNRLDNLLNDLNARKPILEINIPGLKFSDVASSTDNTGTYFYIAWIPELISALYKFLLAIVSIVAVVIIIIQGLRVITSGGGEAKTAAYKKILQSVIGLVIAWGSFAILYNINPALVQFNALRVNVIEEEELNILIPEESPTYESNSSVSTIEPSTLPPGQYDSLFQKYANCVKIDWRILKMISKGENSHQNPEYVNTAGFIGLFQTKPKFCVSKFTDKWAKYADKCTEANLKNPSFNTAVGALYQKNTLSLINTYCKNGDITLQLAIFYSVLNSGYGGTENMLKYAQSHGGCTEANVKEGSRIFWRNAKKGVSAKWFIDYYNTKRPGYCDAFADKLDCMGIRKFEHVFKSGQRGARDYGITSINARSPGICPLDTDTPFPSS
jgi:hypothetical protein